MAWDFWTIRFTRFSYSVSEPSQMWIFFGVQIREASSMNWVIWGRDLISTVLVGMVIVENEY